MILIGFVGWSLYITYRHWAETIHLLDTITVVALSGLAIALMCVPAMLALFCEIRRDTLKRDVAISEMRLDIIVGVYTAANEYFGTALPQYSRYLTSFGLAEELLHITSDLSAHRERAHAVVTQALQELDKHGGLKGIKHETLKAGALADMLTQLLEVFSKHEAVLTAAEVDTEIEKVVIDFKERTIAAE
mgnify:CR=1 FL=1